jgi:hypothetical protein
MAFLNVLEEYVCEANPEGRFVSVIACIGWGSLIWNKRSLDIDGQWRPVGPVLPVEFARQSDNGLITLVLVQGFAPVPTLWSAFNIDDVAKARESLRVCERVPRSHAADSIAHWRRGENPASEPDATISAWAAGKNLEAAIWTNLPPKFDGIDGRVPSEIEVVAYLQALEGETRADAEQYVRRAPRQIATAHRRAIERALGWTPIE